MTKANNRACWSASLCIILNCKDSWFQILQKALNWLQVLLSASFQILYCSFHSFDMFQTFWRNPGENIRAAKWQTVAVGIFKIPGMSAARLAELLRRFKHFGCNRKGQFRGKKRGIYMQVKMFDIGKTVLRLPPSASQAEKKTRDVETWRVKEWGLPLRATSRGFAGGTSAKLLQASKTAASRHCRRGGFAKLSPCFVCHANFVTLGLQASEADFKRLREESLASKLSVFLEAIIITLSHFW